MLYSYTEANDGCKLAFQTSLSLSPVLGIGGVDVRDDDARYRRLVLLIHGFSGSSDYFYRNLAALSSSAWVVAVDLRGHGRSGHSRGGYHVARLAADLRDLMGFLRAHAPKQHSPRIVPVGCSIGAAILWTYVELFGDAEFASMVFVDQAPLQDRSPFDDWNSTKAHRGCFDEQSMLAAQAAWTQKPEEAYRGLVGDCLGYRFAPKPTDTVSETQKLEDEAFFTAISRKCDPKWLARLLADHTRYDHREAIEQIRVPVLVLAGARTGCFPLEGMHETIRRVKMGQSGHNEGDGAATKAEPRWEVFESGHWLFYEEPDKFNGMIAAFVDDCLKETAKRN
ncbi:alpha/beta-hydrolase [Amniculicola lignicola CBS 123094]|uniref:Alpha/beta-hydrolase n=1 Tax=Amniculicola lignicola CBS 123094 TaxID=1392246 RepID=A0A6A5WZX2_9PLEO|nr:alpha/beta-hydrolase [Amniculicola lignicola CBS 123094]